MNNEAEDRKGEAMSAVEIDWKTVTDEQVVKAVLPNVLAYKFSDFLWMVAAPWVSVSDAIGTGSSESEAWQKARMYSSVALWELQRNPAYASPAPVEDWQEAKKLVLAKNLPGDIDAFGPRPGEDCWTIQRYTRDAEWDSVMEVELNWFVMGRGTSEAAAWVDADRRLTPEPTPQSEPVGKVERPELHIDDSFSLIRHVHACNAYMDALQAKLAASEARVQQLEDALEWALDNSPIYDFSYRYELRKRAGMEGTK